MACIGTEVTQRENRGARKVACLARIFRLRGLSALLTVSAILRVLAPIVRDIALTLPSSSHTSITTFQFTFQITISL